MAADINPSTINQTSLFEEEHEIEFLSSNQHIESLSVEVDPLEILDTSEENLGFIPLNGCVENGMHKSPEEIVQQQIKQLSHLSPEEWLYRKNTYDIQSGFGALAGNHIHCTVCDDHIRCSLDLDREKLVHPLLKVLICPKCYIKYSYITFPLNANGVDVRCRWCGHSVDRTPTYSGIPNSLRNCSKCPFAFCEHCIYQNFVNKYKNPEWTNWVCFVCKPTDLWPHRALAWAFINILQNSVSRKTCDDQIWSMDGSICCKRRKRRIVKTKKKAYHLPPLKKLALRQSSKPHSNNSTILYELLQKPVPKLSPSSTPLVMNVRTFTTDTNWIKTVMNYIIENMSVIGQQIKVIVDSIPENDSEVNLSAKIDLVCKLVSVASQQLEKNGNALKMDWEARKSAVLGQGNVVAVPPPCINVPSSGAATNGHVSGLESQITTIASSSETQPQSKNVTHVEKRLNKPLKKLLPNLSSEMTQELYRKYNLKECSVRLNKI